MHWAAYASWPIALVHGFAMGTGDQPVLRVVTLGCAAVGAAFALWRVLATHVDQVRRREIEAQEWA